MHPIKWLSLRPAGGSACSVDDAPEPGDTALGALPPIAALAGLLDEVDYGVILLRAPRQVVYLNRAARRDLAATGCADCVDGELRIRHATDRRAFAVALADAQRGKRRLVELAGESAGQALSVALTPAEAAAASSDVVAVLGRSRLCGHESLRWFARLHNLTPAETRVLELLCRGHEARDIAAAHRVCMTTVRTQLHRVLEKTGEANLRSLVLRVGLLPPMVNTRPYMA